MQGCGSGSIPKGLRGRRCQGKEAAEPPGRCSLVSYASSRVLGSHIHILSLAGVRFENLGGSGWGFGEWPQGNHLAGTACSRTSSILPAIMPQLFPVKHLFISDSTLNSMKENVGEGRKEGKGREGECHGRPLDVFVTFLSSWTPCPWESVLLCSHQVSELAAWTGLGHGWAGDAAAHLFRVPHLSPSKEPHHTQSSARLQKDPGGPSDRPGFNLHSAESWLCDLG